MSEKSIVRLTRADRDVDAAIGYYLKNGGKQVALGFVDALEKALDQIARYPAAASPRYAHELKLPDLRCWPLKRYPYLIFFVERTEHIEIWRILHAATDIPTWMLDA